MNPFSSSFASSSQVSRSSTSKIGPGSSSSASSFKTPRPSSLSGKSPYRKPSTLTRSRVEVLKMEARLDIATMSRSPSLPAGHRCPVEPRPQATGLSGDLAGVSSLLFPMSSPLSTVTLNTTENSPTWSLAADPGGSASRKVDWVRKEKKTKPVDDSDFELLASLLSNLMSDCLVKKEDKQEESKGTPSDKDKGKAKEVQRDVVEDQAENSEMDLLVALLGSLMSDVLVKCEDERKGKEKEHLADNSISMASTSAEAVSMAPAWRVMDDADVDRLSELLGNMMVDCLPGKEKEAQDSAMECDPPASGSTSMAIMQSTPQVLTSAAPPPAVLFATQEVADSDFDMPFVDPSDAVGHSIPSDSGSLVLMDCSMTCVQQWSVAPNNVYSSVLPVESPQPPVYTPESYPPFPDSAVSGSAGSFCALSDALFSQGFKQQDYVSYPLGAETFSAEMLERPMIDIEPTSLIPELPPIISGVEDVFSWFHIDSRQWRKISFEREALLDDDHSKSPPPETPFLDPTAPATPLDTCGQVLTTPESRHSDNAKSSDRAPRKGKWDILLKSVRDFKKELHPYKGLTHTARRRMRADNGRLQKALKGKKLFGGLQKFVRACEPKKGSIAPTGVPPATSHGEVHSSLNCCGVPVPSPPSPASVTLVDCDKAETSAFSPLSSTSTLVSISGPELPLPGKKRRLDEEHATGDETSSIPVKRLKKDRKSFKARFPESDYLARLKKGGLNHEEVSLCIEKSRKMSKDPARMVPPPFKVQSPISSPFSSTSTLVGTPKPKALRRGKNCRRDNEECTVRGEGSPVPVKRSRKGHSRTNVSEQAPSAKSSKKYVESVVRIKNPITEASGSPAQCTGSDVVCSSKVEGPFGSPPASPDQPFSWCNRLYRGVKSIFSFWN